MIGMSAIHPYRGAADRDRIEDDRASAVASGEERCREPSRPPAYNGDLVGPDAQSHQLCVQHRRVTP
jgi:hypothetical protein